MAIISGGRLISGIRSDIKKKSESAKERIKQTTFELLAARGYSNISMRDIASGAGVALSQIAYYYHSKELLISEVVGETVEGAIQDFGSALEKAQDDPITAAREFFAGLYNENTAFGRVLLDFIGQSVWVPAFRERISVFFSRISEILNERLAHTDEKSSDRQRLTAEDIIGEMFGSSVIHRLVFQG